MPLQMRRVFTDSVLVTRESAHAILPLLHEALDASEKELVLDFNGVSGVAPSFFDETLGILIQYLAQTGHSTWPIVILHPPTTLSSKFVVVGKTRGLSLAAESGPRWILRPAVIQ